MSKAGGKAGGKAMNGKSSGSGVGNGVGRPVAYVAGPISRGDLRENVRRACAAGLELMRAGVSPVVPHLSCFMGLAEAPCRNPLLPASYLPEVLPAGTAHEDWHQADLAVVARCHCVLRLPGPSAGADLEEAEAARLGIPVFMSVEGVVSWARAWKGAA